MSAVVGPVASKPNKPIEFDTSCFTFAEDENSLPLSPHVPEKVNKLDIPKVAA